MLGEFWYNGMVFAPCLGFWYNGMEVCTMLGEFWYNGMEVCTMLGMAGGFGTMVWRFVPC